MARPRMTKLDLTGQPALPFALTDTGGQIHRLEDYAGRPLLLVFHRHLA